MAKLNEDVVKALPVPERYPKVHYFAGAVLQGNTAPAGFGVCVTQNGGRSFVLDYRDAERKNRRFTIGKYPVWTAMAAVREARELRKRIDRGEDPLAERRKQEAAASETFEAIAENYLRREGKDLRTSDDRRRILERLVYPEFGSKDIAAIPRSAVVRMLDKIEDCKAGKKGNQGGPVMADRTLALVRKIFNWHASRSDDFRSPVVRGMARTSAKERARKRVLTDDEIRAVWKAADSGHPYARLVRFLMLTGARRMEAAAMPRSELAGDDWILPAARNKTGVDLVRPLTEAARAALPAKAGRFVFSTDGGETHFASFSKAHRAFLKASGTDGWTLHDLRRTARTLMSRAKVPSDHAERCLGHVIGGVREIYDRWEFKEEKAEAYEKLAALITQIVDGKGDNVVRLRRA